MKVGTESVSLEKYIFNYRYIERLETDSVVGNISGEKEAEQLGLRVIPIKFQDKEFAPSTLGHQHHLNIGRCPSVGSFLRGI